MTSYAKLLRDPRWRALREEILELEGGKCARCESTSKIHIHHRSYLDGRKPWEYPPSMLEALCAGCHAAEHGKIPPRSDWTLVAEDDLGEIGDSCELCDEPIRYVFTVYHAQWGFMNVGTVCCDNLTGTVEASEHERIMKRRRRFVVSKRWRRTERCSIRSFDGIKIFVFRYGRGFRVRMVGFEASLLGSRVYESELLARVGAFDSIDNGSAERALRRRSGA